MSVSVPPSQIPTVAKAVEDFLLTKSEKSLKDHRSVLSGPATGHVQGRRAAGIPLAKSTLGPIRFDRVTSAEFATWFKERHKDLAADTKKRGLSSLRQLLLFAIASGWASEKVLANLPSAERSPARSEWLRPEQLVALDALVTAAHFDADQCFMWRALVNTGLRPHELMKLKPSAMNALDGTLVVIGKGRGDGKRRSIPVSPEFRDAWLDYVQSRNVGPNGWMFPRTGVRFDGVGGSERVITDASKPATVRAIRTVCEKVRDLAEEEVKAGRLDPAHMPAFSLSPKVLRRTYACQNLIASHLLEAGNGLDLRSLQEAMGHESLETTAIYLSDVAGYLSKYLRPVDPVASAHAVLRLPS